MLSSADTARLPRRGRVYRDVSRMTCMPKNVRPTPDGPPHLNMDVMRERADEASALLKVLANGQRLRILCLLVDGERSVGEINASVALSQSALSQHLARLREEGLVTTRREAHEFKW